jgi:hypothetical protein
MKRPLHSSGTGGRAAIRLRNRIEVEDTPLDGQGDGVRAVGGSQLAQNILHVNFYGACGGAELIADFLVA